MIFIPGVVSAELSMVAPSRAPLVQSFNFLVAVDDFKYAIHASFDPNDKETAAGEDFNKFLAIVNECIESNSRSEVWLVGHQESGAQGWRPTVHCACFSRR